MSQLFDAFVDLTRAHAAGDLSRRRDAEQAVVEAVVQMAQPASDVDALSHLVIWDAPHRRGEVQTRCGAIVSERRAAFDGKPTCRQCQELDAQDEKDIEALRS